MKRLRSLRAFALLPVISVGQLPAQPTLASFRHDFRPLLIFSATDNADLRRQLQLLSQRAEELRQRQIVVVPLPLRMKEKGESEQEWSGILPKGDVVNLAAEESASVRRRFHIGPDEFAVVLVGKDGGEKLRSRTPVTIETLIKLIDSMPMRQKEIRDGHPA